ncbi:MAG: ABC transporter substrate-binding protein [Proteobacteria bacterium]|nr:ABC transporter substrate-binding protein [Pseudomonadota bacterium]MDA1011585.1 ABC transporter substrate-binding protein [Pseudomonadota bacterium]
MSISNRREFMAGASALAGLSFLSLAGCNKTNNAIRVGFMLPYTGTYAKLGTAIENGFRLALAELGDKPYGKSIDFFTVDDESNPAKATDYANKIMTRDNVDVVIGTVHSGVAMGMIKVAKETGTLVIIPNAGANAATGSMCAPNVFRTSFSNWQPTHPLGKVMVENGHKKSVFVTWKYGAGEEALGSFREGFEAAGGEVIKELFVPFPNVEFQAILTEIASLKPDAVACFFAGGGAVKFVKDYAAAGLKSSIPLYGSGFLTEGVLEAQGEAAEGITTTLHYADRLQNVKNLEFREAYRAAYNEEADVYAVQGYDAGLLLIKALEETSGDLSQKTQAIKAMEDAEIDSPRGLWRMSKYHNPIQNFYTLRVENGINTVIGTAWESLEDPGVGCSL